MVVSDISEHEASFEFIFLILRGFLQPFRDFIELYLICYMLRVQDAKRRAQEEGTAHALVNNKAKSSKQNFFKKIGISLNIKDDKSKNGETTSLHVLDTYGYSY